MSITSRTTFVVVEHGNRFFGVANTPTGNGWQWGPLDRAVRFARRQDAEAVLSTLTAFPMGVHPKIVQHSEDE